VSQDKNYDRHTAIKAELEKHLGKKIEGGSWTDKPKRVGGQLVEHSHDFTLGKGLHINIHYKNGHWMGTTDHTIPVMHGGISVSASAKTFPEAIKKTLNFHLKAVKGIKSKD